MKRGGSRWRAVDRILPGDSGRSLPSVYSLLQAEVKEPHVPPSLSGCHSAPSIWLKAQPPQGRLGLWDTLPLLWMGSTSSDWQPTALIKNMPPLLPVLSTADMLFKMCNLWKAGQALTVLLSTVIARKWNIAQSVTPFGILTSLQPISLYYVPLW